MNNSLTLHLLQKNSRNIAKQVTIQVKKQKSGMHTYPLVLSAMLLPWLDQVLFSRPLTSASLPYHPEGHKEKTFNW